MNVVGTSLLLSLFIFEVKASEPDYTRMSDLAEEVRKDWGDLTDAEFRDQLIKDANNIPALDAQNPALQRLHYFFPNDYFREENGNVRLRNDGLEKSGK